MKREVEFRGLGAVDKGWIYGNFIHNSIDAPCIIDIDADQHEVILETVGQFTGIKSKITKRKPEGDRVFEGDIIKYHKNTGKWLVSLTAEVIFEGGAFYAYWEREMLGKKEVHKDLLTRYERKYLSVIGNIYEQGQIYK